MPKIVDGDIIFSADETTDGNCPVCQSCELDYGCSEVIDNGIVYPFTCESCGATGKQYDKSIFDGYEINYVPEKYTIPNLILMQKIAVIQEGYVRNLEVFAEDPATIKTDSDWEEKFHDHKCPCQFVGVFEGADENEIKKKAAESEGVHPGVITLLDIRKQVI